MRIRSASIAVMVTLTLSACGSGGSSGGSTGEGPTAAKLRQDLNKATDPSVARFPEVRGRTLQEVADSLDAVGPEVAPATSVFTPGENRFAFGVIDPKTGFVYGPTAVYVAIAPDAKAKGPFPAPADLLVTETPFRSRQAATEEDPFAAIYSTRVPFDRVGTAAVLVVTQVKDQLVAAPTAVRVVAADKNPIPAVGQRPPAVATETVDSALGDIESIDTRLPPDDMHDVSFKDVLGRKPVALLFATPQLCQSRVCGPVVDIAMQLKERYGDRMEFIHQEVYVDNDPSKGLRRPLQRFGLPTEPWLFTVDSSGRIAARLEGSFGLAAFEDAIRAALSDG